MPGPSNGTKKTVPWFIRYIFLNIGQILDWLFKTDTFFLDHHFLYILSFLLCWCGLVWFGHFRLHYHACMHVFTINSFGPQLCVLPVPLASWTWTIKAGQINVGHFTACMSRKHVHNQRRSHMGGWGDTHCLRQSLWQGTVCAVTCNSTHAKHFACAQVLWRQDKTSDPPPAKCCNFVLVHDCDMHAWCSLHACFQMHSWHADFG